MNVAVSVVPVRLLDTIPTIDAVKVDDDRSGATMRSLCATVDLARHAQVARIKRNPKLASAFVFVLLETPGGLQATEVLLDWAIPIWASGLQTTRLSKEKQAVALILKEEAVAAIRKALSQPAQAPEQDPPTRPSEAPWSDMSQIKQELSSLIEGLDIKQAILLLIAGLGMLETEQQNLRSRIEKFSALEAEWQEERAHRAIFEQDTDKRLLIFEQTFKEHIRPVETFSGLPLERIGHLFVLLRRLRSQQGMPLDESLAALAAEFNIPHATDLPETAWPDILAWFHQRLQNG